MKKKETYPAIKPKFIKNAQQEIVGIYLENKVYESIFNEITELQKQLKEKVPSGKKRRGYSKNSG